VNFGGCRNLTYATTEYLAKCPQLKIGEIGPAEVMQPTDAAY
jgi:hypothetical protein